jgi:membrane protein
MFQAHQGANIAASLAYYALFSIFPLLLVTLSVVGFVAGPESGARVEILRLTAESLPEDAFTVVRDVLASLSENRRSVGLIGFATLLLSASGFFGALDRAFDTIWALPPRPPKRSGVLGSALKAARERAAAFGLVLACVLLLLLSTVFSLALGVAIELAGTIAGGIPQLVDGAAVAQLVQLALTFALLTLALALVYRTLPATDVAWSDVWPAAALAALLFLVLQRLVVGGVVNLGASYQGYGVIGGVMLLMVWLFISLQVLLLGSTLSRAIAERRGRLAGEATAHDEGAPQVA